MNQRSFELREEVAEDGAVRLQVTGTLDALSAPRLRQRLHELRIIRRPVRLDLSQLDGIDTQGVEVLVEAHGDALLKGWQFGLEPELSPNVAKVLRLAHLDRLVARDG